MKQIYEGNGSEIIGFDLGHGESALTIAAASATTEPQVLDVQGDRKSIITAAAQHPKRGVLIGEDAYTARNLESLRIHFKNPHLERLDVREPIKLFAKKIVEILLRDAKIRGNGESHFIVGCPSGWDKKVRDAYSLLLQEAGLSPVTIIAESRAAFIFAKEAGDLKVSEEKLAGSVLIIDIGSSTTDFTAVQSFKEYPIDFGHNELGAGLLDKAILERTLNAHGNKNELQELFNRAAHWKAKCELKCRRVKEMFFSNEEKYVDEPANDVELIEAEKDYLFRVKISQQDMAEILSAPLPELGGRRWTDAFRDALLVARERTKINPPQLVLLTGGASRMAFTKTMCEEVFPDADVRRGAEPEFAIAKGLAWAGRVDIKSKKFRNEVDALLSSSKIREVVEKEIPSLLLPLADLLAKELPDRFLIPAFNDWRDGKVATLAGLETVVEERLKNWLESSEGKQTLAPVVVDWFEKLKPEVEKLTNPICDKYQIGRSALSLPSSKVGGKKLPSGLFDPTYIVGIDDFGAVVAIVVGIVVAVICGGAGTALLFAGPLGLVIGFFIGLIVAAFGTAYTIEYLKNANLPGALRWLVPPGMMAKRLKKEESISLIRDKILEGFQNTPDPNQPKPSEVMAQSISEAVREQLNKSADAAELLIK